MMKDKQQGDKVDESVIKIGYEQKKEALFLIDIVGFVALVTSCYDIVDRKLKEGRIKQLKAWPDLVEIYHSKQSGRSVLCESSNLEHLHEQRTTELLADVGYDVIFAPKGMFSRQEKKFDVFLLKSHIILKVDLKAVSSKNPLTIAKRIKEGSDQAPFIVLHICSDIERMALIDGLRSGVYKNKLIREIMLIYKKKLYRLPKNLVESWGIFDIIK